MNKAPGLWGIDGKGDRGSHCFICRLSPHLPILRLEPYPGFHCTQITESQSFPSYLLGELYSYLLEERGLQ